MTITLKELACLWLMLVATAAGAWFAGQSQVAPIQVQPGGAAVSIQPQQIRVEGASVHVPPGVPPVVNVAAPSPVINVMPAEIPKVDVHADVRIDTVQAMRTVLGPLPKEQPDIDEHGKLLPRPK